METIKEFVDFIENLKSSRIELHHSGHGSGSAFRSLDLRTLTKNIKNYSSIHNWMKSLNLTEFLKKNIIISILKTNPPENVKNELLAEIISD